MLDGPLAKLERAARHIDELREAIDAFRDTQPVSFPQCASGQSVRIEVPENLPIQLSIVAGDVLHNLRSALDQLACQLPTSDGGTDDKAYFPFGRNAQNFESELKSKAGKLSDDAKDFLRALAPYRGGNDFLRAVHDLNIIDKHRAVLDFGPLTAVKGEPIGEPTRFEWLPDFSAINPDSTHVPLTFQPVYDYAIVMSFDVIFRDNTLFGQEPAVAVLWRLHQIVEDILTEAISKFFGT
jgi:hypothetical protein